MSPARMLAPDDILRGVHRSGANFGIVDGRFVVEEPGLLTPGLASAVEIRNADLVSLLCELGAALAARRNGYQGDTR